MKIKFNYRIFLCLFSISIFLISQLNSAISESSYPGYETTVTTAEGVVYVYKIGERELKEIRALALGEFIRYVNNEVIEVRKGLKRVLCYVPEEIRGYARERLEPKIPVLIQSNNRPQFKTEYDLVGIGFIVKAGYEYSRGEVLIASPIKIEEIWKQVIELRANVREAEGGAAITTATGYNPDKSLPLEEGVAVVSSRAIPSAPTVTTGEGTEPTEYYWVNPTGNEYTYGGIAVAANGEDTSGRDGSNTEPWRTITYALERVTGSNINLVGTTYSTSTGETFPLVMKSGVNIVGHSSTIDGGNNTNGFSCIMMNGVTGITIDSLTVTGGLGTAASGVGGGITIQGGCLNITISSCTIANNTARVDNALGGGISIMNPNTATSDITGITISNCIISNNTATNIGDNSGGGGGIGIHSLGSGFTISANITGCTISNNRSYGAAGSVSGGGGILITGASSTTTITNCTFDTNRTVGAGGGINITESQSVTISRCTFSQNRSDLNFGDGVGVGGTIISTSATFINCLLSSNFTYGISCDNNNSITVNNCTINGHTSAGIRFEDTSSATTRNTVFSSNDYGIDAQGNATEASANYCFFYNSTTAHYRDIGGNDQNLGWINPNLGSNNLGDADPQYKLTPDDNKYDLLAASPCIDVGVDGFTSEDREGRTRVLISGPRITDIGAFEYTTESGDDPPITGRVYDSVIGENISSPVVGIYRSGETTALSTTTSNPFTFNVDPGSYYIAVSKDGYAFPSQVVASTVAGDHGDVFTASSTPLTINIPIDPDGWLYIEKTVNKKRVVVGDIVTYNIKIQNKHWFKSVDSVELIDEIVNGFKYIPVSSLQSPVSSNHKIIFDLGTVSANSTQNISYQVRVGSGIASGRYKATAVCRKETTNEQRSNTSSAEIEVVEDALFTRGTIIGKVFYDVNGNGIQDGPLTHPSPQGGEGKGEGVEAGVPGVKIATEYGVVVETDKDGKYHIADVPPSRHLLKIMPASIPKFLQELGFEYTTENPAYVKITEGLLAKVNFGITQWQATALQKESGVHQLADANKFFIVALGEGTLRNLETSGNIEMVNKDDRYDEGLRVDGRLAFYLKGKVLGKYLITASLDTDKRPKGRNDQSRLFTNLDPDKYYPVYGDASQVDYSATDTQDIGYVLIEWDNSFAKWGNFHTNLPMYNRTLSGGKVEYRSVKKTKFGEPFTEVDLLYANARQKPAHNEFIGTGGSLYYLKHRDIIEGSEKVRVEVRDRLSRVPISTVPLQEERDYEIDYDTGRILLKRPLNISSWAYKSSIVSNDILSGERVYLIVNYEYYVTGGLSKEAVGGRAKQHIGNHIDVEGMYVEEDKEDEPYQLYRGSSTLRLNEDTYVTAGYTHTKETQLGSGTSIDGGLSFTELDDDFSSGKSGGAVDVKAETRLFKNTDITLSYNRQDPYFSTTDSLSTAGTQKYVGNVITQLTKDMYVGVKHLTQRLWEGTIGTKTVGTTDTHITTGILDWIPYPWDLRLECQHQEVTRVLSGFTYMGFIPYHNNDFIAGRVGYNFAERLHAYIRGQGTVQGRPDNQVTVGSDIKILKDTYINLAETVGDLGDSTLLGVTSQLREDTDIYANIETGNHLELGKFTRTSFGQATQLTKDSKVYASHDYSNYQERLIRGNLLGYNKKVTDNLLFGLTYERSNIEDTSTRSESNNLINRDSGSISLGYLDVDYLRISTKLELRNDRGRSEEKRQWVTENEGQWYITQDLTILGRANWGWTDNRTTEDTEAEFTEIGTGLAFRPVKWDRLNLLAKYSYITDLPPDEQVDFIEEMEQRRHVIGIEGGYDICKYLGLVGKFAYRGMEEKVGLRDWTDSDTYLYIGRLNFHITDKWDIAAEYRTLANPDIEDSKSGWLFEVDRELAKYVRIGAGYNFTDYDDDLRNEDEWDAKGWFVRVSGKY